MQVMQNPKPINEWSLNLNWVWIIVAIAWASLLLIGHPHHPVYHPMVYGNSMIEQTQEFAFGYTLLIWMVMTVAMMLPSALPMVQKVIEISELPSNRSQRSLIQAAFLCAYLSVWMGFAIVMAIAQVFVDRSFGVLEHHLHAAITALILIGMGLFQFTPLKKACL